MKGARGQAEACTGRDVSPCMCGIRCRMEGGGASVGFEDASESKSFGLDEDEAEADGLAEEGVGSQESKGDDVDEEEDAHGDPRSMGGGSSGAVAAELAAKRRLKAVKRKRLARLQRAAAMAPRSFEQFLKQVCAGACACACACVRVHVHVCMRVRVCVRGGGGGGSRGTTSREQCAPCVATR